MDPCFHDVAAEINRALFPSSIVHIFELVPVVASICCSQLTGVNLAWSSAAVAHLQMCQQMCLYNIQQTPQSFKLLNTSYDQSD